MKGLVKVVIVSYSSSWKVFDKIIRRKLVGSLFKVKQSGLVTKDGQRFDADSHGGRIQVPPIGSESRFQKTNFNYRFRLVRRDQNWDVPRFKTTTSFVSHTCPLFVLHNMADGGLLLVNISLASVLFSISYRMQIAIVVVCSKIYCTLFISTFI